MFDVAIRPAQAATASPEPSRALSQLSDQELARLLSKRFADEGQARAAVFDTLQRLELFPLPMCLRHASGEWEENGFFVAQSDGSVFEYSVVSPAASGKRATELVETFDAKELLEPEVRGLAYAACESLAECGGLAVALEDPVNAALATAVNRLFAYGPDYGLNLDELHPRGVSHTLEQTARYGALLRTRQQELAGFVSFEVRLHRAHAEDMDDRVDESGTLHYGLAGSDEEAMVMATALSLEIRLGKVLALPEYRNKGAETAALLFIEEVVEEHLRCIGSQLAELSDTLQTPFEMDIQLTGDLAGPNAEALSGALLMNLQGLTDRLQPGEQPIAGMLVSRYLQWND